MHRALSLLMLAAALPSVALAHPGHDAPGGAFHVHATDVILFCVVAVAVVVLGRRLGVGTSHKPS